jgi:hypothetical protein
VHIVNSAWEHAMEVNILSVRIPREKPRLGVMWAFGRENRPDDAGAPRRLEPFAAPDPLVLPRDKGFLRCR